MGSIATGILVGAVGFVSLVGCASATATAPRAQNERVETRPSELRDTAVAREVPVAYRALFERDRAWVLLGETTVSSDPTLGPPWSTGPTPFNCRVDRVERVGRAWVSTVMCDDPTRASDTTRPHTRRPRDVPAGVWIATDGGLWRLAGTLTPRARERVRANELPPGERLLAASPITESRHEPTGDGDVEYEAWTPDPGRWCMKVANTAGHTTGWTLCLGESGALTGTAFDQGGTSYLTTFTSE